MTLEVERKRRELFEAWFESLNHRAPEIQYSSGGHYYVEPGVEAVWNGFNAALDAVEIELPDVRVAKDIVYFNDDVIDAITATGLGLRIKE